MNWRLGQRRASWALIILPEVKLMLGGPMLRRGWESFSSMIYAVYVMIPIVDFGKTEAWAPSTNRRRWGKTLFYLRWPALSLGWLVTALAVAALTGIMQGK